MSCSFRVQSWTTSQSVYVRSQRNVRPRRSLQLWCFLWLPLWSFPFQCFPAVSLWDMLVLQCRLNAGWYLCPHLRLVCTIIGRNPVWKPKKIWKEKGKKGWLYINTDWYMGKLFLCSFLFPCHPLPIDAHRHSPLSLLNDMSVFITPYWVFKSISVKMHSGQVGAPFNLIIP